jgi:CCR4-NOT transcription complex subunit 1
MFSCCPGQVQAPEEREDPDTKVADRVAFLINNLTNDNISKTSTELASKLTLSTYHWFARYLVHQRAANEANFQPVYVALLQQLPEARMLIRIVTEVSCALASSVVNASNRTDMGRRMSFYRSLGTWIGRLTVARNVPVLRRQLDLKALLVQGYTEGFLMAAYPFVNKLMVEGVGSEVFGTLRNPWVRAVLGLMRDIYDLPSLKMALKFELESTVKAFGITIDDLPRSGRLQPIFVVQSQDFKEWAPETERLAAKSRSVPVPTAKSDGLQPPQQLPQEHPMRPGMEAPQQQHLTGLRGGPGVPMPPRGPPSPTRVATAAEQHVQQMRYIKALVVIPAELEQVMDLYSLHEVVPLAIDRAVSDIMMAAVERSSTISCKATSHIVLKDFVNDPSAARVHEAAKQMVMSLAGSLALVTCREAIQTHLVAQLTQTIMSVQSAAGIKDRINDIATVLMRANHAMACSYIEQVAVDRAAVDIEEHVAPVRCP